MIPFIVYNTNNKDLWNIHYEQSTVDYVENTKKLCGKYKEMCDTHS